jgi:hypothetical protein
MSVKLLEPCPRLASTLLLASCNSDSFDISAWKATAWEHQSSFERMKLLRGLLDGDRSLQEANHAAWRGLGYRLSADGGSIVDPEGIPCAALPDMMSDEDQLTALLFESLPSDEVEDELNKLDTLVETLHGEVLTRQLIDEGDAEFMARRLLVMWLYSTQPSLLLG